jgi:hypothetical protein
MAYQTNTKYSNGSIEAKSSLQANGSLEANGHSTYYMLDETENAREKILRAAESQIPSGCEDLIRAVTFTTANNGTPHFPCPFKETETAGALKAVEAGIATAIADLRYGKQPRKAVVDLERASCFFFSTYIATVGGYTKGDPESKKFLKGQESYE